VEPRVPSGGGKLLCYASVQRRAPGVIMGVDEVILGVSDR
jgi:hypothetical protein